MKDKSLLAEDFKAGQLPGGATGPQGPAGPQGQGGPPGPPLADGSVTTLKLADNAVTGPKLATDSVGPTEIQDGAIDSGEIADGTLNGVDIGKASGSAVLNFPSLNAGDCDFLLIVVPAAGTTDQVTVSPEADYLPATFPVTIYGQAATGAGLIRVVACNVSTAAVDVAPTTFHYTVIDN
ncbi:MAG: hypothetical protein ACR2ML_12850 [Solirubrobacteraceae bacterium]